MDYVKLAREFVNAYAEGDMELCGHVAAELYGFEWLCGMKVRTPEEGTLMLRHVGFKGLKHIYQRTDDAKNITFCNGGGYPPDLEDPSTGGLLYSLLDPQSRGEILLRDKNAATVHLIPVHKEVSGVLALGVAVVVVALYNAGFTQKPHPV